MSLGSGGWLHSFWRQFFDSRTTGNGLAPSLGAYFQIASGNMKFANRDAAVPTEIPLPTILFTTSDPEKLRAIDGIMCEELRFFFLLLPLGIPPMNRSLQRRFSMLSLTPAIAVTAVPGLHAAEDHEIIAVRTPVHFRQRLRSAPSAGRGCRLFLWRYCPALEVGIG